VQNNEGRLLVSPMKNYAAPKIPALEDVRSDPALLKKMPNRWATGAVAALLAGIMLSGCTSIVDTLNRTHHGGAGTPVYVAYLTEQEAWGIIRVQLEKAGLNFNYDPPGYSVTVFGQTIGIDLFDKEKNVAIAKFDSWGFAREHAELAEEEFSRQTDINVGVFYTPGMWFDVASWSDRAADEERAGARISNEERMIEQVQAFITLLQERGIIE